MFLTLVITAVFSLNVSAITGKIGNGRMVLNLEDGDVLERSILVINDNNISVNITLSASQEIVGIVKIKDTEFVLNPGEQKKAGITINAKDPGKYDGKVNVAFRPIGVNESGVGLSSQIILTVYEKGKLPEDIDSKNTDLNPDRRDDKNTTLELIKDLKDNISKNKIAIILLAGTIILIFAVAFLINAGKRKKRGGDRGDEEKVETKK